jgi:peptidoglycan/xylan/chitin deacetylase (PgdA/CDA1 family)
MAPTGPKCGKWVQVRVGRESDKYTNIINGSGGIVLFHDTKKQTAAMLYAFLRFLKKGGYRVVHAVSASP